MALQENKDSYAVKALSLSEFVLQCTDCHQLCLEKTARVVENRSRAPRGWDSVFHSVAEERRTEDLELCESRCRDVHSVCPSQDRVRQYEQVLAAASLKAAKGTPPSPPLLQDASRCEHAVEVFSNVLFALTHKPSKVSFAAKDPQTGNIKYDESHDGAPTEAHRKVLEGAKNIDNEILRRWSKARQDRLNMEEQGIVRPAGTTAVPQVPTDASASSGTAPRW
ncbi:ribosomal P protein AGP2beta-1 [Novymonas esmeraldas]|uniref:Ribosomal P protein AGP2beta-1 n=1 Tax=Novymonas esmeraldas TaxID=1808958 RepID=A0AAW0EMQ7_9TRYP